MGFEPTTFCMASKTRGGVPRQNTCKEAPFVLSVALPCAGSLRGLTAVWGPNGDRGVPVAGLFAACLVGLPKAA